MTDGDMRIMGFAEGVEVIQPQVTQVFLYVLNSGQGGAFVQELVRIGCYFCTRHGWMKSWRKKKR